MPLPADLRQLASVALKIGTIGFGGPAAHISLLQREVVEQRKWLTDQEYLDAIGAANLIPGPTSTELMLYIGWLRGKSIGLLVTGVCFITPAAVLSLLFAILYLRYGALPAVQPSFRGIQAAVLAIIAAAGWQLARTAARTVSLVLIGCLVAAAAAAGLPEILALLGGGALGMIWLALRNRIDVIVPIAAFCTVIKTFAANAALAVSTAALTLPAIAGSVTVIRLGLFFLMVGSVLYGSGYVLIAFLEGWLVTETHLLTRQQLLDAVAVGQFTPGPVSTTAVFIGYLIKGYPGAIVSAIGMFLPSFVCVALLARYVQRIRNSRWMGHFLDAVNTGAVGLIFLVSARLASENITSWRPAGIALLSLAALIRFQINATWLILAGGLAGYLWL